MYSGTVLVTSKILNHSIRFPPFESSSSHPYVKKLQIASVDGQEITSTIDLDDAPAPDVVVDSAVMAHTKAILRLGCLYRFVVGATTSEVQALRSGTDPDADIWTMRGVVATASVGEVSVITDKQPADLRATLEHQSDLADVYFELFHQARTSSNEVVEFLGYYQIVSSVLNEPQQSALDDFFLKHGNPRPTVTAKPNRKAELPSRVNETVYSRLRNEIAHVRIDPRTKSPVKLSNTKTEISQHVSGLRRLARIAIQQVINDPS